MLEHTLEERAKELNSSAEFAAQKKAEADGSEVCIVSILFYCSVSYCFVLFGAEGSVRSSVEGRGGQQRDIRFECDSIRFVRL